MIHLDDLHLDRPGQRYLAEIFELAARRRPGVYDCGAFTPTRGREHQAAACIEAAALRLADVLAEHLEQMKSA